MSVLDAPPALRVEEVEDLAGLEALETEWTRLWEDCPQATPFHHPGWLIPWWSCFGAQPGWTLWTLAVRRGDRLVAVAPLFVHPGPDPSIRQLSPVGISNTDYLGPLAAPGDEDALSAILAHLAEHADRWDVADFEELRAGDPLLGTPLPPGLKGETAPQSPCPVLALPDDPDVLIAGLSRWMRRNLRVGQRKLEESGGVQFETATAGTLPEFLDALFILHTRRWESLGQGGVLQGDEIRRFHEQAAARLLAAGVLRSRAIRANGRIVGIMHGMAAHGRGYAYMSGFDPALHRENPGTLVAGYTITEAIREGAREFDFLRGQESYKYDWGAVDTTTTHLRIRHPASPAHPW